jgi:hypothetical protein
MRKRSTRKTRPAAIPPIVLSQIMPEVEIGILSAVSAFRGGYATPGQFDILLDTRDLLLLGASGVKDRGMVEAAKAINDVLADIKDSWNGEYFPMLSEYQLNALDVLADISIDFWKRQSGSLYQAAYMHLQTWRIKQGEKSEDRCQENRPD